MVGLRTEENMERKGDCESTFAGQRNERGCESDFIRVNLGYFEGGMMDEGASSLERDEIIEGKTNRLSQLTEYVGESSGLNLYKQGENSKVSHFSPTNT